MAEDANDATHRVSCLRTEATLGLTARRARGAVGMSVWRPRAMLRLPGGTSRLIVLPAPTNAPSPMVTGATSAPLAYERAGADVGTVFGKAVVIAGDGAGADVRLGADPRIADVGQDDWPWRPARAWRS